MNAVLTLRNATVDDVPSLLAMLRHSAIDQGFPDELAVTETDLREDGFGSHPRFRAILAEWNNEPAGMALFFFNYSTWGSRSGLYLEDLYVRAEFRGKRVGRSLLIRLAQIAVEEDCGRFQWVVHSVNAVAVSLYESIGAQSLREWTLMSIKGDGIRRLAESDV